MIWMMPLAVLLVIVGVGLTGIRWMYGSSGRPLTGIDWKLLEKFKEKTVIEEGEELREAETLTATGLANILVEDGSIKVQLTSRGRRILSKHQGGKL